MRSDDGSGFGVRMSVWSKQHVVTHIDMTTYQLHECEKTFYRHFMIGQSIGEI